MSIGIYTTADPDEAISEDGALTNPLLVSVDGKLGGVIQQLLYIRNDDENVAYSGINLAVISDDISLVDGTNGYTWKLAVGDTQPTDSEWNDITTANTIDFDMIGDESLGDTSTYLPFWIRASVDRNSTVNTFTNVKFEILADELLVI